MVYERKCIKPPRRTRYNAFRASSDILLKTVVAFATWAMDNWPAHRLKPDGQPDGRLLRTRPQVRQFSTASRINGKADDEVLDSCFLAAGSVDV